MNSSLSLKPTTTIQYCKSGAEALDNGCGYDAPGSFAAWLSGKVDMHAWLMPGKRYDIGDMKSYEAVRDSYKGVIGR